MPQAESATFQIKEQKVDDNILTLKVEVGSGVVSDAFKRVHRAIASQVRVPGFRAGKCPMPVLVQYVGKDNFLKQVRRELLPQYYYEAVESLSQRPIAEVEYTDGKLSQGEPFEFEASVAIAPRIELGDYESLSIEKPGAAEVSDAEMTERIHALRHRFARTENAPEAELTEGHLALVNIEVTIDGQPYQTLGRKNVTMEIGKDQYLSGFDKSLLGKKRGDELEFPMKLQGESIPERHRGKEAHFKVNIKAIRTMTLPEVTDDFAKDVGSRDLAALREKLSASILDEKRGKLEGEAVDALKKALIAMIQVEPPARTIDKRVEDQMARLKDRIRTKGVDFERWMTEEGRTEEELRNEQRKGVIDEMKLDFALDAVVEREKIQVPDEEVVERIRMMARALGKHPDDIMDLLDQSGNRIVTKHDIAREHALDKLKEKLLGLAPAGHEGHSHVHHSHDEGSHE